MTEGGRKRKEKQTGQERKFKTLFFFGDTRVSGRGGACDVEAGNTVTEITS